MKTNKILNAKAEDLGERTVRFKISSEVEDRDGDILVAEGCDFTNFAKNPQFLGFHNSHDFPLGIPKNWTKEKGAVYCDVYFPEIKELATDPAQASEKAKLVDFTYNCYKTGMLNAVSVGFLPKKTEPRKEGGFLVKEWELLEFSAVAVPANQEALAQAAKSFGFSDVKDFLTTEKSGKRISAETQKVLDAIKECNGRIKSCLKEMDSCRKEMEKLLSTFDDVQETEPAGENTDTDAKDFIILDDEFNLSDVL